jgi:hypothetical protein
MEHATQRFVHAESGFLCDANVLPPSSWQNVRPSKQPAGSEQDSASFMHATSVSRAILFGSRKVSFIVIFCVRIFY